MDDDFICLVEDDDSPAPLWKLSDADPLEPRQELKADGDALAVAPRAASEPAPPAPPAERDGAAPLAPGAENKDGALRTAPDPPVTELQMFLCMYAAQLDNIGLSAAAVQQLQPSGLVLAINSNYRHVAAPGFEELLKLRPTRRPVPGRAIRRARTPMGDGTCFNSALEPVVHVVTAAAPVGSPLATIRADVVALKKVKFFVTTGHTQVPNVRRRDLSDGKAAVTAWADYLSESKLRTSDGPVRIRHEGPVMMNFKFGLNFVSDRQLIRLPALAQYLGVLEAESVVEGVAPEIEARAQLRLGDAELVLPPGPISAVEQHADQHFTCVIKPGPDTARVKVFKSGKWNLLGLATEQAALAIHAFISDLFALNWQHFVVLRPLRPARPAKPVVSNDVGVAQPQAGDNGDGGAAGL